MRDLAADLRYALRIFRHSPGFAAVALLTLALGIGANTAIFSVVSAVLVRPLPLPESERLVRVFTTARGADDRRGASPADFVDWRASNRSFGGMAAITGRSFNLTGTGDPEQILGMLVTAEFFPIVGARAAAGRLFLPEEYESPGNAAFALVMPRGDVGGSTRVVLGHALWQRRFGASSAILGGAIQLDGRAATVVGILPADIAFAEVPGRGTADCWIPQRYLPGQSPRASYLDVLARLRPGVGLAEAQAEMDVIGRRLAIERPESNADRGVRLVPLADTVVGPVRQELLVLAGAVGCVLLIACANAANLLLARASGRGRELAVRAALGAGRGRLVRQLLTESVALALAAGAAGLGLAAWGVRILVAASPRELPRAGEIGIDARVLAFTFVVSTLTGIACGALPALRASGRDLVAGLKDGGAHSMSGAKRTLASALVVVEIALALVLVVGAGLLARSFIRLQSVPLGFEPRHAVNVGFALGSGRYTSRQAMLEFLDGMVERVEKIPGVEAAGVGATPLRGSAGAAFYVEGRTEAIPCGLDAPSPGYFRAAGMRLQAGRSFTEADAANAPEVAIVNRTAARRCWPGEDAIGRRITLDKPAKGRWMTVVGVVEDVRYGGLEKDPDPYLYVPLAQSWILTPGNMLLRFRGDPAQAVDAVRSVLRGVDPDQPLVRIATLEELLWRGLAHRKFLLALVGVFSAIAFVLAAVGISSVMAHAVSQRTREIGIRVALGADRRAVLRTVLGEGIRMIVLGEALGLAAAAALHRVMRTLVFGVATTDPASFAAVGLAWAAVGIAACLVPAHRALAVDPIVALRQE